MTDPVPSKDQLPDVDLCAQLRALPAGARLLGYTAAEEIDRLRRELAKPAHEREPPHCSTCACGMPATISCKPALHFFEIDGRRCLCGEVTAQPPGAGQ